MPSPGCGDVGAAGVVPVFLVASGIRGHESRGVGEQGSPAKRHENDTRVNARVLLPRRSQTHRELFRAKR